MTPLIPGLRLYSFSILLLFSLNLKAQEIKLEIIKSSGYKSGLKYQNLFFLKAAPLSYLEPGIDTVNIHFIATIKARPKNKYIGLGELYDKIVRKAEKMGANSFRPVNITFEGDEAKRGLTLDIYFTDTATLRKNEELHKKNVVYIFGNLSPEGKTVSYKINDTIKYVKAGYYYKYPLQPDYKTKFTQNTLLGNNAFAKAANKPALFLPIIGFGNGVGTTLPTKGIGVAVHSNFGFIDNNFGLLLLSLFKGEE